MATVVRMQLRSTQPSLCASPLLYVEPFNVTATIPMPGSDPSVAGMQASTGRGPLAFTVIGAPSRVSDPALLVTISTGTNVPSLVY